MQEKNQTFQDFARRTEELAAKRGINLGDLPGLLGISRAMLFGYRKGRFKISGKAWRKLEQAERESGLAPSIKNQLESTPEEDKKNEILKSAAFHEVIALFPEDMRKQALSLIAKPMLEMTNARIIGYCRDAESLGGLAVKLIENPSDTETREQVEYFANRAVKETQRVIDTWVTLYKNVILPSVGLSEE